MRNCVSIANLFCCFFLTGLIWVIQLLHYPSFGMIEPSKFASFHHFHVFRISLLVMPTMTVELLSTGMLLSVERNRFWLIQFALVILIWLSTALLSVPLHNQLALAQENDLIDRLVFTNWPRTFLWSLRSLAMLYWLSAKLAPHK